MSINRSEILCRRQWTNSQVDWSNSLKVTIKNLQVLLNQIILYATEISQNTYNTIVPRLAYPFHYTLVTTMATRRGEATTKTYMMTMLGRSTTLTTGYVKL